MSWVAAELIWFVLLVLARVGFIEPGLKFHHPSELVVMELLMSENPDACFALARPFRWSLPSCYMRKLLPVACHSTPIGFNPIILEIHMLDYIATGNVLFEYPNTILAFLGVSVISPEIWRNCWKMSLNYYRKEGDDLSSKQFLVDRIYWLQRKQECYLG